MLEVVKAQEFLESASQALSFAFKQQAPNYLVKDMNQYLTV